MITTINETYLIQSNELLTKLGLEGTLINIELKPKGVYLTLQVP